MVVTTVQLKDSSGIFWNILVLGCYVQTRVVCMKGTASEKNLSIQGVLLKGSCSHLSMCREFGSRSGTTGHGSLGPFRH